jgi:hypothetical protein
MVIFIILNVSSQGLLEISKSRKDVTTNIIPKPKILLAKQTLQF